MKAATTLFTRYRYMTILAKDKILRFKDRLFRKNTSRLMQKGGGHGLNPIASCRVDDKGNLIIPTEKIINFFTQSTQDSKMMNAKLHFSNLYMMLSEFTKEIEECTFESDIKISEKEIHAADNKIKIEYLTKNIIINYFNQIKLDSGKVDYDLLDRDLKKIIKISGSGRDYRTLVENTLKSLIETFKEDQSWRKCLEHMNDADLVCKLVGAKLPKIDPKVISKHIQDARKELLNENQMLTKILNTKAQLLSKEMDQKQYLQMAKKLDKASEGVLGKMDDYFYFAHSFMNVLGLTPEVFLGKVDPLLKSNLAALFFNFQGDENADNRSVPHLNYSQCRHRMGMLLQYPELVKYCRAFNSHNIYQPYCLQIFKRYYDELDQLLAHLISSPEKLHLKKLDNLVAELKKLSVAIGLDDLELEEEKQNIQKKYLAVVRTLKMPDLDELLPLTTDICLITSDSKGQFPEAVRSKLVSSGYSALSRLDTSDCSAEEVTSEVQKILVGYSMNYKPQRFYFHKFFEIYVGSARSGPVDGFNDLLKKNEILAKTLLKIYATNKAVSHLVSKEHSEYAAEILKELSAAS